MRAWYSAGHSSRSGLSRADGIAHAFNQLDVGESHQLKLLAINVDWLGIKARKCHHIPRLDWTWQIVCNANQLRAYCHDDALVGRLLRRLGNHKACSCIERFLRAL